ncbi:hypothetical protein C8J57DRAFT_1472484 [Mycena rebaudengoi]|nr:hypothetical protein C8J57DRAFT_1472484 [Mycena rebaudengoi]
MSGQTVVNKLFSFPHFVALYLRGSGPSFLANQPKALAVTFSFFFPCQGLRPQMSRAHSPLTTDAVTTRIIGTARGRGALFLAPIPKLSVIRRCTQWKSWLLIVCTGVRSIENVPRCSFTTLPILSCMYIYILNNDVVFTGSLHPEQSLPAVLTLTPLCPHSRVRRNLSSSRLPSPPRLE